MIILKLVFWYEIMLTRLYSKYSNARGLMVAILYRTPSAALIWGLLPSDHSAINKIVYKNRSSSCKCYYKLLSHYLIISLSFTLSNSSTDT